MFRNLVRISLIFRDRIKQIHDDIITIDIEL